MNKKKDKASLVSDKKQSGNEINNCVTLNSVVYILCKVYIANILDAQQRGTEQNFTKYEVWHFRFRWEYSKS